METAEPPNGSGSGRASTRIPDGLTPRQREVLAAALRLGYFETPKHVRLDQLAERFGLSKTTVMEHLRKGERAVLKAALGVNGGP